MNDGRWIYHWDGENRLQRMTPTPQASAAHSAAGHSTGLPTLDFLYDWRGRRISKQVTYGSGNTASSTITSYIYDGWNIVATVARERNLYNLNLEIVRSDWGLDLSGSFQGAGGVGGLLATRTTDSNFTGGWTGTYINTEINRHFPSYDGNGNIIAWTADTGATTTTRDFDAFGNIVTNQGTRWSASTAFGFSTKYEDVETGLLYYGYRYYDPVTGRWPSRDPIGEEGGMNLYGMVGNNLVSMFDLLGQQPLETEAEFKAAARKAWNKNAFQSDIDSDVKKWVSLSDENRKEISKNAQSFQKLIAKLLSEDDFTKSKIERGGWIMGGATSTLDWTSPIEENGEINRSQVPPSKRPKGALGDIHTHPDGSSPTIKSGQNFRPKNGGSFSWTKTDWQAVTRSRDSPVWPDHVSYVLSGVTSFENKVIQGITLYQYWLEFEVDKGGCVYGVRITKPIAVKK